MNRLHLSEQDLKKVRALREKHERSSVDEEWYFIAQFGFFYGFEGIRAILNNEIDADTANMLMRAGQKIHARYNLDNMTASFVGSGSVRSKKPSATFKRLTRDLRKEAAL